MSDIPPVSMPPPVQGNTNPYAAPTVPQVTGIVGLWRQGNVMIMHKLAPLPPMCVKSNQPATQFLRRNLQWHPPWVIITILAGLLVYVILALILTKRATINIGLTDEWMARRRKRMLIAWLVVLFTALIGAGLMALGFNTPDLEALGVVGLLILIFGPIGGLAYGQYACRMVHASQITDTHAWLKGIHPGFLDRLPVWPYGA